LAMAMLGIAIGEPYALSVFTVVCAVAGPIMLIFAAGLAIVENYSLQKTIDSDMQDIPELANYAQNKPSPLPDHVRI
jgi:hypothetical protein